MVVKLRSMIKPSLQEKYLLVYHAKAIKSRKKRKKRSGKTAKKSGAHFLGRRAAAGCLTFRQLIYTAFDIELNCPGQLEQFKKGMLFLSISLK
ncbi:MAG: hypothetical protein IKT60_01665 [Clostridia bacterium]|nr:hypothetical protein [Clostridia bacterium]